MFGLSRKALTKLVDFERVKAAIALAESRTSGEIRVSVAPWFWGSVERAAAKAFQRLGMRETRDRNGILFFIVPSRRAFMVLGDEGIHARVGQEFWDGLAATLSSHFKLGEFSEGLVQAIAEVGEKLAQHFPHQGSGDRNELADDIDVVR